ncbi:hypothetical protein BGZ89_012264 [Linnemannia elongata]|nr:hypothetical protein BGZ89_012264 [Linnemannia elongata]
MLILPKYKEYRIPVAKKVVPAHVRIELLDIYHYLVARFEDTDTTMSYIVVQWLEDQKRRNLSVSAKMIKDAAKLTYTVLQDWFEIEKGGIEVNPSFCASWFDGFKKRHNITYCQLRGEAGSVDMDAIKPELGEITQICSEYYPDNIYNCDEIGLYLKA